MKTRISHKPASTMLAVLLLGSSTILATTVASAAQPPNSLEETVVNEGWASSPGMQQIAVHSGREIVHHLSAAQAALEKGDSGKALGNVIAASRLNDSVMRMAPYITVSEDLFNAKGKLALEETDRFYDELLPIYAELDEMEAYSPKVAQQARGKLKQAEELSRTGKSDEAANNVQEVISMLAETDVYLPVVYVHGQLEAAQNALSETHRDLATAKAAIDNALDSLTALTEGVAVEEPTTAQ